MFNKKYGQLRWFKASGSAKNVGYEIGCASREAVHDVLLQTDYWQAVTAPERQHTVTRLAQQTQAHFPAVWQELQGLAEGLQLPFAKVMAWNSRGDMMSNIPDGCTTVQLPGNELVIGHNEDGMPELKGHAFVVEVAPENAPGFISFCYPGSIPGHTFAITQSGLAQAVNNLRLTNVEPTIPRMIVGRAMLDCRTMDDVTGLLRQHNGCGGFHFTLAQAGDPRLLSIEIGGGECAQRRVDQPDVHANHALFLEMPIGGQEKTNSSMDRQVRGAQLIAATAAKQDPMLVLRDTGGTGLPIHRQQANDPDCENTLASVVMHVGKFGVKWSIYDQNSKQPVFSSSPCRG